MAVSGLCQFVSQPLNYPGTGYWPYYYSIVDHEHVWVGTFQESGLPCSFSVKTTDAGESWIFDPIPVTGNPSCVSICGWDANTCFFVFMSESGPTIWKTADGGSNWTNLISTQFTGSFINFYHAFSADTGLAMGDPRDGYFEIQLTQDGGNTWTRVPSAEIPDMLPDEMGLNHSYSAVNNSIWFTTNRARCYRSTNKGQTWDVGVIVPDYYSDFGVCFSTGQKGVIWNRAATSNQIVATIDGGVTLQPVSFPTGYNIMDMSRVPGIEGGFVITAYKTGMRVYFTPDMFNTLFILQSNILSNGAIEFYDESTGWLGGGESGYNEIYKFAGILTSTKEALKVNDRLTIIPNPSNAEALVRFPTEGVLKSAELQVSDLTGKAIYQSHIQPGSGWTMLNSADFANGVYLVEIISGNNLISRGKWVVKH
jgi:hypothetical protein